MDHDGHVIGVVGANIREAEPCGHLEVELDRAHLPRAADRVGHVQVDLGPVERTLAGARHVVDAAALERGLERRFGDVPVLVGAQLVVGPERELGLRYDSEDAVEQVDVVEAREDLVLDLVERAEDVGVVLGHVPHPQEAVQRPRQLVPVQRRGLGVAQRQLAVAAALAAEEQHVARAVHRLQAVRLGLALPRHEEHVVAELLPVARRLPELDVVEERRLHLDVAPPAVLGAAQVLERVPDHHAARVPQRRPRRVRVEVEQVELAPQAAMVAAASLLDLSEVGVEIGLAEERRAVDARQHRARGVAPPVGTRRREQLERLDGLGASAGAARGTDPRSRRSDRG